MNRNSRFPSLDDSRKEETTMNSRFRNNETKNPFISRRRNDGQRKPFNSRAEALRTTVENENYKNPFQREGREEQRRDESRRDFGNNNLRFRSHNNNFGGNSRRRHSFRKERRSESYFKRNMPPKKKEFSLKNDDFPPLGGKNTVMGPKCKPENQISFIDAAERGQKCATPPPGPGLPPVERLERPPKEYSDDESTGWNTEDEKAARELDPSDDEDDDEDAMLF